MTDFFIVGECILCSGSGDIIALKRKLNGLLVFHCPACGCTWEKLPVGPHPGYVVEDVAPDGVTIPTLEDLDNAKIVVIDKTDYYDGLDGLFYPRTYSEIYYKKSKGSE